MAEEYCAAVVIAIGTALDEHVLEVLVAALEQPLGLCVCFIDAGARSHGYLGCCAVALFLRAGPVLLED